MPHAYSQRVGGTASCSLVSSSSRPLFNVLFSHAPGARVPSVPFGGSEVGMGDEAVCTEPDDIGMATVIGT
jgi:hypothetical protein